MNVFEIAFVNSSAVSILGYNKDSLMLRIGFKSGVVYEYSNMEYSVFQELSQSESVGNSFRKYRDSEFVRLSESEKIKFLSKAIAALNRSGNIFIDSN